MISLLASAFAVFYAHSRLDAVKRESARRLAELQQSVANATETATRADADVVVVGAVTSAETAAEMLAVAEAGRLVIGSIRAAGAADTIHRFAGMFPVDRQGQARQALGTTLVGVVNQRLLERADGAGWRADGRCTAAADPAAGIAERLT